MKGIYEVLHYTWINDKICDTVVHDREIHYGEIPSNKTTTYTVNDLDVLEKKIQTDGISGVWWEARHHEMAEGLGSSPIGFEQKENLLKMEDEKKQRQASGN